jgi:hypothetical protein
MAANASQAATWIGSPGGPERSHAKAPGDWRTPRRCRALQRPTNTRSVLDCRSPLPLLEATCGSEQPCRALAPLHSVRRLWALDFGLWTLDARLSHGARFSRLQQAQERPKQGARTYPQG